MEIGDARPEQARQLAYLINLAGEGIPEYLWTGMCEGDESPMDVGARRAARDSGGVSYTNARTAFDGENLLGMIIAYRLDGPIAPSDLEDLPEVVRPLVELESEVPGSWYINAIATFEKYRGRGVASHLMADAEFLARNADCSHMSLIVASGNHDACRLYQHLGYMNQGTRPVVEYPGCLHGGNWELLLKAL